MWVMLLAFVGDVGDVAVVVIWAAIVVGNAAAVVVGGGVGGVGDLPVCYYSY